jgi:hypothetical protein
MKLEYFEIDRVIEELPKNYAAPCTTTWFKVTNNKRPSKEEYRKKVIEFMKHFEHTLSNYYPDSAQKEQLTEYVKRGLQKTIHSVKIGNDKEVERRYRYYVDYE